MDHRSKRALGVALAGVLAFVAALVVRSAGGTSLAATAEGVPYFVVNLVALAGMLAVLAGLGYLAYSLIRSR